MLKKLTLIALVLIGISINGQKKNILKVDDISILENFVKYTKSTNRSLLRKINRKIKKLKRKALKENKLKELEFKKNRKEVVDIKIEDEPLIIDEEKVEFDRLINEREENHVQNTLKLLNTFMENNSHSKEVILFIENKSDCDLLLTIKGKKVHKLPISKLKHELIGLEKGHYELSGKLCNRIYKSKKHLIKNLKVTLQ